MMQVPRKPFCSISSTNAGMPDWSLLLMPVAHLSSMRGSTLCSAQMSRYSARVQMEPV